MLIRWYRGANKRSFLSGGCGVLGLHFQSLSAAFKRCCECVSKAQNRALDRCKRVSEYGYTGTGGCGL